jgi:hypothetical protein
MNSKDTVKFPKEWTVRSLHLTVLLYLTGIREGTSGSASRRNEKWTSRRTTAVQRLIHNQHKPECKNDQHKSLWGQLCFHKVVL